VARSAQHEVHVEQNPIGADFLCTLHQKFQFNGNRMGSGRCDFSLLLLYILIENYTTFPLKSIPLIEDKPVALQVQQQHKNDDKHGYKTRDYQAVLS
jgi:hypothetical protein